MRHLFYAASLLALTATPALAEAAPSDLDAVVVTRLPTEAEDVQALTVVGAEEIERRQAVFAADVLPSVPGVSLSRNGGFGGVTTVRLRGAAGDKTLVLVDGVVQNDPSSPNGGFDFAGFDLADVERIEVLQGPQGSLWGSDAIGGVISFTTRELDGWRASLEGGQFSTWRGTAGIGVAADSHAFGVSLAGFRSEGVSKAASGNEDDGFESWTAAANGRIALSETVTLDGRVRYNRQETDLDGYDAFFTFGDTADRSKSESWTGYLRLQAEGLFGLDQAFSISLYDLSRDNISAFPSSYEATRTTWRWQAGRGGLGDAFAFAFGAERDDTEASLSSGAVDDLGATSVFGFLRISPIENLSLSGALRYDDPDEFDGELTARLAAAYDLGAGFTVRAAFGQGFKTPTISQQACDFCFPPGPSTGLKPETAEGWDLGLVWRSGDGRFLAEVSSYRLEVEDQISYGIGRYVNIDRALTTGVVLRAEAELAPGLSLAASYAFTDAVDRSTGAELLRVPEDSGAVSLTWDGDRLSGALSVRGEGEQSDSDPSTFSPARRDGFVVADLAAGWKLTDRVEITGRVENLTDETYQESLGYGEAGRAVYIGIRFRP